MIRTTEILTSKSHIEPLRDEGYVIYKLGWITPVNSGKREAKMLWGNVKTESTGKLITQPGHSFVVGNCIKRFGTLWILAKADIAENAGTVGVVSEIIDTNRFRYITGGLLPGTFVDGANYFLSTTTAGVMFIQSFPEVWEDYNVREFIGTGTPQGLDVEIDVGVEIVEMPFVEGHDVVSGNGMDFETNTPVTLGTPSEVNSTTENEVTEHSHTHKLGNIDISTISKAGGYGALYNWYAATDNRKITSSDEFIIPTTTIWENLFSYVGIENSNTILRESGWLHWDENDTDPEIIPIEGTNLYGFSSVGSGSRNPVGHFESIRLQNLFHTTTFNEVIMLSSDNPQSWIGALIPASGNCGCSIRLCNTNTSHLNGYVGTYTQNNGETIPTIVINGVEWTMNLNETKFRNGDWISGYDNGVYTPISNEDWETRGGNGESLMCYYDDNELLGSGEIPLSDLLISEHNKLKGLDGGDIDNNYYGHLTQVELQFIQSFFTLPTYADNASATAGGLQSGNLYKTGTGQLMIVY
jgi:uncharacterized protein (TIGR02145 family)